MSKKDVPYRVHWVCVVRFVQWCRGAAAAASVRSCQRFPPCHAEPVHGGSKMDLLLAKAGTIRNDGNASVMTYLGRKKLLLRYNCGQRKVG